MCTYTTERCAVTGSGKGPQRWTGLTTATVYYDHPVHAMADHTLNIDLAPANGSPAERVALELTAEAAVRLAAAIVRTLGEVPADLTGLDDETLAVLRVLSSRISTGT
jgi:Family of unknown function (DUF6295)